jgi:hypothetical protein
MRIRCLKTVELEENHDNGDVVKRVYEVNRNYQPIKVTITDGQFANIHFDWGYIKDVNMKIFSFKGPVEQILETKQEDSTYEEPTQEELTQEELKEE